MPLLFNPRGFDLIVSRYEICSIRFPFATQLQHRPDNLTTGLLCLPLPTSARTHHPLPRGPERGEQTTWFLFKRRPLPPSPRFPPPSPPFPPLVPLPFSPPPLTPLVPAAVNAFFASGPFNFRVDLDPAPTVLAQAVKVCDKVRVKVLGIHTKPELGSSWGLQQEGLSRDAGKSRLRLFVGQCQKKLCRRQFANVLSVLASVQLEGLPPRRTTHEPPSRYMLAFHAIRAPFFDHGRFAC